MEIASRPLEGSTLGAFGPMLCEAMKLLNHDGLCRPPSMAMKRRLFPLPLPGFTGAGTDRDAFLHATIRALNHMNGVASSVDDRGSLSSLQAVKRLRLLVRDCEALDEVSPKLDFPSFFRSRGVDYAKDIGPTLAWLLWKN